VFANKRLYKSLRDASIRLITLIRITFKDDMFNFGLQAHPDTRQEFL